MKKLMEYPIEILLGLAFFVQLILDPSQPGILMAWFFPFYVLTYVIHSMLREASGGASRLILLAAYILSWALWIPFRHLFSMDVPNPALFVSIAIALTALLIGTKPLDNQPLAWHSISVVCNCAKAFLIGFGLIAAVFAVFMTLDYLFELNLSDLWYIYAIGFVSFNVIPLLCCIFVGNGRVRRGQTSGMLDSVLVDWILSPALVIYSVILYCYIAKILIDRELPEGGVAFLVSGFMLVALAVMLVRHILARPHWNWFFRFFPAIAAGPVVLLWVGTLRRISDYGFTEPRFYLLLLTVLLTAFTAMLAFRKTSRFWNMGHIAIVAFALFTYIPGISASSHLWRDICRGEAAPESVENKSKNNTDMANVYDFSLLDKNGQEVSLKKYEGKVLLIVNTATGCGFTPQYEDLEAMYHRLRDRGLEILDIPCDQFGHQAPGTDAEISEFCTLKFGADFPQFKKSEVNGEGELSLYKWLKEQKPKGEGEYDPKLAAIMADLYDKINPSPRTAEDIQWNFTKFLVDRKGNVVARFEPTYDMKLVEAAVSAQL